MYSFFYLISFLFVFRKIILEKEGLKKNFIPIIALILGLSFGLIQVFFIYYHFKVVGLFIGDLSAPSVVDYYSYVPTYSGIARTLLEPSFFDRTVMRLYYGMQMELNAYKGSSFFLQTSVVFNNIGILKVLKFYVFFILFCLLTFYGLKKYSGYTKVIILVAFLTAIFTAIGMPAENRYYLLPRTVYLLLIIDIIFNNYHSWYQKIKQYVAKAN